MKYITSYILVYQNALDVIWYATARVYGGRCGVLQGDKGTDRQRPKRD